MPSPGPIVDITVITGDSHRERTERGRKGRKRQEGQQALHLDIQTSLCTESPKPPGGGQAHGPQWDDKVCINCSDAGDGSETSCHSEFLPLC